MMKFLNYLQEEFAASKKGYKSFYEIYVNPTKIDLLNLRSSILEHFPYDESRSGNIELRFIADPKKKELFVFYNMLTHNDAARELRLNNYLQTVLDEDCLFGFVYVDIRGKLHLHGNANNPSSTWNLLTVGKMELSGYSNAIMNKWLPKWNFLKEHFK